MYLDLFEKYTSIATNYIPNNKNKKNNLPDNPLKSQPIQTLLPPTEQETIKKIKDLYTKIKEKLNTDLSPEIKEKLEAKKKEMESKFKTVIFDL